MPAQKLKVGDFVAPTPAVSRNVPGDIYEVVKQLGGARVSCMSALCRKASSPMRKDVLRCERRLQCLLWDQ